MESLQVTTTITTDYSSPFALQNRYSPVRILVPPPSFDVILLDPELNSQPGTTDPLPFGRPPPVRGAVAIRIN